ncbi:DUF2969 domain-containing protein [Pediococcus claussenii]|uniref:DUF2969 family protein n=1 Tax=Pediococcus claussenii (strain ATCC BAA-344 / DSM 14800 / JCM 18046 / KCTC 3811 / LMG 21948 / P06) TaxID=701521 RepID=G8PCH8_PEDCP|nr:DUF2969 domain-containing protein [Pediococcus claussenii]AEV94963.1 hypothetical protein PECL_671 [Pediococcus claussenii ATCC BAA-344]ANZ70152.1 hypothetical protein AYR57_07395 [Pediococcus claussenii]ANZ71968.1 hypothetical protein AYR58_07395 [Pediococcus claussenii]KRN19235.1 hypothetical protein IV79_GL001607 [Pediococcus claussenii]
MSRKQKSIQIEIEENKLGERTINQVLINQRIVGTVEQADKKTFVAVVNKNEMREKSFDEAVEWIISEYNLHQK